MAAHKALQISWYADPDARSNGEPGIRHSFMASLATALHHMTGSLDPVWLMGTSTFAFRIYANERMCPSVMSIFNWDAVLAQAVQQAGYECIYVSRMWHEGDLEEERRLEAHQAIVEAIERGIPAVVWDVGDDEWGLVIGFDDGARSYDTLNWQGKPAHLAYERLGRNGIDVLSVAIPSEANGRIRKEAVINPSKGAVAQAQQDEWTDRPEYQDGLPVYDLRALLCERWALLVEAGKGGKIGKDICSHATY